MICKALCKAYAEVDRCCVQADLVVLDIDLYLAQSHHHAYGMLGVWDLLAQCQWLG